MPQLPHLANETHTGLLLTIKTFGGKRYRYQNYYPAGTITWSGDGQRYEYLPANYPGAARTLELDTSPVTVEIANDPTIREIVQQEDGFRKATVVMQQIFPDNPNASPVTDRLQVSSCAYDGPVIQFTLKGPLSAITGTIPSKFYSSAEFPHLPIAATVNLR